MMARALVPIFLALGCSLPAAAQEIAAELFDRLDRNRDGYLSREELESEIAKQGNWIAVDRDRDGRISRAEFGTISAARSAAPQNTAAAGGTPPPQPPSPDKE